MSEFYYRASKSDVDKLRSASRILDIIHKQVSAGNDLDRDSVGFSIDLLKAVYNNAKKHKTK
jgi:hypothetical protein